MTCPRNGSADLGLSLPPVVAPAAAYCLPCDSSDLVYTAGQVPMADGTLRAVGKVGAEVSIEDAVDCARIAALNALAAVVDLTGDLDVITRIVKVDGVHGQRSGFH